MEQTPARLRCALFHAGGTREQGVAEGEGSRRDSGLPSALHISGRHLGEGGLDAASPNSQTASDIVGFRVSSWPNAGKLWRVPEEEENLDEEGAIERLNRALALQYRSVLQYTLSSGSLFGFEFQAFGDRFWEFARAELDDARRLVEKITALGGEPSTEVAELRWTGDPGNAVAWLIESESDAIENLQAAIEPTGREGRSEALEHMLEHLIMRKQDQVDYLMRARRQA
jgi:bacterioferritin